MKFDRRIALVFAGLMLACCVGFKAAPTRFDGLKANDIEAKSIVLRADDGSKITLSVANGTAGIWIENGKTKHLVSIYAGDTMSAVGIWKEPGQGSGYDVALGLGAGKAATPTLQLIDRDSGGHEKCSIFSRDSLEYGKRSRL